MTSGSWRTLPHPEGSSTTPQGSGVQAVDVQHSIPDAPRAHCRTWAKRRHTGSTG